MWEVNFRPHGLCLLMRKDLRPTIAYRLISVWEKFVLGEAGVRFFRYGVSETVMGYYGMFSATAIVLW